MAAPLLSARVPADQRFRVVYRLTSPLSMLFGGADEYLTAAWQGSRVAVVISPATTPVVGGVTRLTGPLEAFCSIDIKSAHVMPSVTWDSYLAPFRRPNLGFLGLGVNAEISSVELLSPAALSESTAPAARTSSTQTPAAASKATSPTLAGLVTTTTNRLLLVGLLVLAIVVAWQMGPQLMQLAKARK
jgi:hypothetical protein